MGGPLRGQRLQPEHALPQRAQRALHRHRGRRRLRVQPGRQAPGRHGGGGGRLRPQRGHGHLQDQLRRRHLHPLREHRPGPVRGPHVRGRDRDQHALAGLGGGLPRPRPRRLARRVPGQRPRLPRGGAAEDRGRLQAAQGGLPQPGLRAVRGRDRAPGPPRHHAPGRPRRRLRRLRQRRRRGRAGQQRARHARPAPPRQRSRRALAVRAPRGHRLQPQRDRRPGAAPGRRRAAGGRGPRRGELQLAERPARPLRPRDGGGGGAPGGAVAERARGALDRGGGGPPHDRQGRHRPPRVAGGARP